MRCPAPVLTAALVLGGLLAACSGVPGATGETVTGPAVTGIAPLAPIVPEERSTCEAMTRADLAVLSTDPVALNRSADALATAATRAPAAIGPRLGALAAAYDRAAEDPRAVVALREAPERAPVLAWFATRCGGLR